MVVNGRKNQGERCRSIRVVQSLLVHRVLGEGRVEKKSDHEYLWQRFHRKGGKVGVGSFAVLCEALKLGHGTGLSYAPLVTWAYIVVHF